MHWPLGWSLGLKSNTFDEDHSSHSYKKEKAYKIFFARRVRIGLPSLNASTNIAYIFTTVYIEKFMNMVNNTMNNIFHGGSPAKNSLMELISQILLLHPPVSREIFY